MKANEHFPIEKYCSQLCDELFKEMNNNGN